jgi:hypothetical protein
VSRSPTTTATCSAAFVQLKGVPEPTAVVVSCGETTANAGPMVVGVVAGEVRYGAH